MKKSFAVDLGGFFVASKVCFLSFGIVGKEVVAQYVSVSLISVVCLDDEV